MKIKLPVLLIFLFGCIWNASAQDPQFAQFYASPMQLSPAMTGVHPGQWRAVANYRAQWNSILNNRPFRTISTSFDAKTRVGRGDFFAYGLTFLRDEAGQSDYTRLAGDLSLSYMKQLDGSRYSSYEQFLIGGAQVGFGQHSLKPEELWFSSQFNNATEQVDLTLASGETIDGTSDMYLNFNAGLMWYAVFDDNQSLYIGGALHHINAPKVSFIAANGEEEMDMKWTAHMGGELPFSSNLSLMPAIAVIGQGPSLISLYGANIRYTNRDWKEVAIRAGAWGHLVKDLNGSMASPSVTITTILEIERWNIGLSYDVAANQLAPPTNGRGAFEMSLIYYAPAASRRDKVSCPKL